MAIESGGGPLSRRFLLAGAGSSALGLAVSGTASGQQPIAPEIAQDHFIASDGFQVVSARQGVQGPTLHVRRGDEVRVRLRNDLTEPTALHWRGVRIDNAMDGVPGLTQAAVEPGASFDYRFKTPDAGTFWYGPPVTPNGMPMPGASGALLVAETPPVAVDQDVLLFVPRQPESGAIRDIAVRTNERLRLRLVNAAASRALVLRIERHVARVMAIDGQPAEPFVLKDSRVILAPGNRIDLFVDAILGANESAAIMMAGDTGDVPVARLVYGPNGPVRPAILPDPQPSPSNSLPLRMDFRGALRLDLTLNGMPRATQFPPKPLFRTPRGRTVVVALVNRTAKVFLAHVHGHHFRLLDKLDDGWKPFWLDTLLVPPQTTMRIAFVADNPGRWAFEIREIERDGNGMPSWFDVT